MMLKGHHRTISQVQLGEIERKVFATRESASITRLAM
jgi:hypothetical protein